MKKPKSKCCRKVSKKGKICKRCPLRLALDKDQLRALQHKAKKGRKKAA